MGRKDKMKQTLCLVDILNSFWLVMGPLCDYYCIIVDLFSWENAHLLKDNLEFFLSCSNWRIASNWSSTRWG